MTVTTTARNQADTNLGFIIFGIFGCLFFGPRRRSWRTALSTLLLLASLLTFVACGAIVTSINSGISGTPTGTYNVIVTGTAGALTRSTTLTLIVR